MTPPGDGVLAMGVVAVGPADVEPGGVVPVRRDLYGRLDWAETVTATPESLKDWDARDGRDWP